MCIEFCISGNECCKISDEVDLNCRRAVKGCHVRETSNTCSSQPTPEAYTRVYPIPRSVAIWPLYLRIDYLVVVANQYVAPRTKIGKFDESTSDIRASTALRRQQS